MQKFRLVFRLNSRPYRDCHVYRVVSASTIADAANHAATIAKQLSDCDTITRITIDIVEPSATVPVLHVAPDGPIYQQIPAFA